MFSCTRDISASCPSPRLPVAVLFLFDVAHFHLCRAPAYPSWGLFGLDAVQLFCRCLPSSCHCSLCAPLSVNFRVSPQSLFLSLSLSLLFVVFSCPQPTLSLNLISSRLKCRFYVFFAVVSLIFFLSSFPVEFWRCGLGFRVFLCLACPLLLHSPRGILHLKPFLCSFPSPYLYWLALLAHSPCSLFLLTSSFPDQYPRRKPIIIAHAAPASLHVRSASAKHSKGALFGDGSRCTQYLAVASQQHCQHLQHPPAAYEPQHNLYHGSQR